jgi:hypothetical protein
MDLTKEFPRSVKAKIAGVTMIGRTADKAKAELAGTIGEYHYNCPMDQAVFGFLGIDHQKFLDTVKNAKSDADIDSYVKTFADKKSPAEIEGFNEKIVAYGPEKGTDAEKFFLDTRNTIAPDRTDVTAWADLIDLEEKRDVPRRVAA